MLSIDDFCFDSAAVFESATRLALGTGGVEPTSLVPRLLRCCELGPTTRGSSVYDQIVAASMLLFPLLIFALFSCFTFRFVIAFVLGIFVCCVLVSRRACGQRPSIFSVGFSVQFNVFLIN